MKTRIISLIIAITYLNPLYADNVVTEVPTEMSDHINMEKKTSLGEEIQESVSEVTGSITQKESSRISQAEDAAIKAAEAIKEKTIANAIAVKEKAISQAKKTNTLAKIEAKKIKMITKAEAIANAEKEETQAKLLKAKSEALSKATSSSQKALSIFNLELEDTTLKLRSVVGTSSQNVVHKILSTKSVKNTLKINNIEFKKGTNILTNNGNTIVAKLANILKNTPTMNIEIAGYTDSDGSAGYNKKLSQSRVDSVRRVLISKNIKANRLVAKGYGESKPLVPNTTQTNKQKNRRVEIYIVTN